MQFTDLSLSKPLYLYAGSVPRNGLYDKFIGLALKDEDEQHIRHDITQSVPLPDCCVDIYQAVDVLEHIELDKIPFILSEIYRLLKTGGIFRLGLPDYRCDVLYNRTQKDENGELQFDLGGGGAFVDGKVVNCGHVWFPKYETVLKLLEDSPFKNINFYHYYSSEGIGIMRQIDYSIGHVSRTPDFDVRVQNPRRPMSIVVDCVK